MAEIAAHVGVSRITLSQHLVRLRRWKIVKVRRNGSGAYYQLAHPEVTESCKIIQKLYQKVLR